MKKALLALTFVAAASSLFAAGKDGKTDEILRRSGNFTAAGSYPQPIPNAAQSLPAQRLTPAVSTGYYMADSDENTLPWRPNPGEFVDTTFQPGTWRRILSGPNQAPTSFWDNNPDGYRFFRNPANPVDSMDNAFAGPIPIGFPFYFNGIRYDSFYVSTNGLIAFSNRRYVYEEIRNGNDVTVRKVGIDPNTDDTRNLADTSIADNWGFQAVALGVANGGAGNGTATGGIRNPNNTSFATAFTNNAPVIAPFWDDLQVSVWNKYTNQVDDFSKVYYKRSPIGDKLIIYFVNLMPIGAKGVPAGTVTFPANIRPQTSDPWIAVQAQVVLNRLDSSITYLYDRFDGSVSQPFLFQNTGSETFFRRNTTIGVSGLAQHVNYVPPTTIGATTRYYQWSEYLTQLPAYAVKVVNGDPEQALKSSSFAIRFKQWKNVLRVVSIRYFAIDAQGTRTLISNPANYEVLAGDPNLGTIQPVAILQNLTNDIQGPAGVNFTEQGLPFTARYRILNDVTDQIAYSDVIAVDSSTINRTNSGVRLVDANGNALAGYNPPQRGVPPYGFVEVSFRPYQPNPFRDLQIGRFTSMVIGDPRTFEGAPLGDQWPFDDTTSVKLFVLRRLSSFNDYVDDYSATKREGNMPSVLKWVNFGTDALSGDDVNNNPTAPRGPKRNAIDTNVTLNSPVIKFDRIFGTDLQPTWSATAAGNGDELRSFPVNIAARASAVMMVSVQRTGRAPTAQATDPKTSGFDRGWSDGRDIGPEPRFVFNANQILPSQFGAAFGNQFIAGGGSILGTATTTQHTGLDRLVMEFANPSPDAVSNITNIPAAGWGRHPRMSNNTVAITDNPALTVYGGGGHARGFNETIRDSALTITEGVRPDIYDDGKDQDFNKFYVRIPTYILNAPNDGARNFRFRFRQLSYNNQNGNPVWPPDDNDDFFVDNVKIITPRETPELEVNSVRVNWAFQTTPASQATSIPISVIITNNSEITASNFVVQVLIQRKADADAGLNRYVYCRPVTIPAMNPLSIRQIQFPSWNARLSMSPGVQDYIVSARVAYPWNESDEERLNDSTYTEFRITNGPILAYDQTQGQNNVPEQAFSGRVGKGLNLFGTDPDVTAVAPFGADAGNGSGQFAMRFSVTTQDTIYGFQAFFAGLSQSADQISFSVYQDSTDIFGNSIPRRQPININTANPRNRVDKLRGFDDVRADYFYDQYTTYNVARPIVLAPGEYWLSVAQAGSSGFELGGSRTRGGMVTMFFNNAATNINSLDRGVSLAIFKPFRKQLANGSLVNDNRFAFENTRFSGNWIPFLKQFGNTPYPHLNATGTVSGYASLSRGFWIPMLRPFFGTRTVGAAGQPVYEDNCVLVVPVEVANFDGLVSKQGIQLIWETASESNNAGFYVDKRIAGSNDSFESIGFVAGAGNSTTLRNYDLLDAKVAKGVRYEYRLRSVDFDGTEHNNGVIERTYTGETALTLEQNSPNPFSQETMISFGVVDGGNAKVEIIDLMGNVVKVLFDGAISAGSTRSVVWDGSDASGASVPNGVYTYRLTSGNQSLVRKLNVVR